MNENIIANYIIKLLHQLLIPLNTVNTITVTKLLTQAGVCRSEKSPALLKGNHDQTSQYKSCQTEKDNIFVVDFIVKLVKNSKIGLYGQTELQH